MRAGRLVRSVVVVGLIRVSAVAVLVLLLAGLLLPGVATAHGVSDTADVSLAQSLGGNELTVIIRRVPQVPGPLQVDVLAHRPVRAMDLRVFLGDQQHGLDVRTAGMHSVTLHVEAPGPHELILQAGAQRALLPFRVLTPRTAGWELVAYGGFTVAGLALAAALITATRARPGESAARERPDPPVAQGRSGHTSARLGAVLTLSAVSGLALTVALTAAGLSSTIPPPLPYGAAPVPDTDPAAGAAGRPYALGTVSTDPVAPVPGRELTLRLGLVDGSTGRPVDDLVAHHGALAHTVVTSADTGFFAHLHPVRTDAGELSVRLMPDRPGRYLVHTELERADSGSQLVSGEFTVSGEVPAGHGTAAGGTAPAGAEPGIRSIPEPPVAGRPSTLELDTGADDLQLWLGMAGHLIVRDDSGRFFAHVHELGSMAQAGMTRPGFAVPDETVANYGPLLRFTYTFPAPGRYRAWVQYARDFEIHTVPLMIDVLAADAAGTDEAAGDGSTRWSDPPDSSRGSGSSPSYAVELTVAAGGPSEVTVRRHDGAPVRLDAVMLEPAMPQMGHAAPAVTAEPAGPGRFVTRGALVEMPGRWEVLVRLGRQSDAEFMIVPVLVE